MAIGAGIRADYEPWSSTLAQCSDGLDVSREAPLAIGAEAATNIERHSDPVTDFDAVNRFAYFDDLTKVLVTEDGIGRHVRPALISLL
jgi:hypothetical protein